MSFIILAEDDEISATIAVDALLAAGHAAAWFPNGREALAAMRFRKPHMVLLDCNMPELNGIDTLRMMRQDAALFDVPVMMLTVRDGPGDEGIARFEGANAYLAKPFDPDRLVVEIEALIETWRVREARRQFDHYGSNGFTALGRANRRLMG